MLSKAINFIRVTWRPMTCVAICATMFVHGVGIPIYNTLYHHESPPTDLNGLSLLVTAIAGTFAVREWGKAKGNG